MKNKLENELENLKAKQKLIEDKLKNLKDNELKKKIQLLKPGVIIEGGWDESSNLEISEGGKYRQISKFRIDGETLHWSQPDNPGILEHEWSLHDIKIVKGNKLNKLRKKVRYELILNGEYSAVVTKENVKVGCQVFTHNTIKKLYLLSQKALKSK